MSTTTRTPKLKGNTMAKSPAAANVANAKKSRRPSGPRTLYVILKPGTDVAAVREMISKVTFNGRTVLNDMGDAPPAVLRFTVDVEKRGNGSVSEEVGEAATIADAA